MPIGGWQDGSSVGKFATWTFLNDVGHSGTACDCVSNLPWAKDGRRTQAPAGSFS